MAPFYAVGKLKPFSLGSCRRLWRCCSQGGPRHLKAIPCLIIITQVTKAELVPSLTGAAVPLIAMPSIYGQTNTTRTRSRLLWGWGEQQHLLLQFHLFPMLFSLGNACSCLHCFLREQRCRQVILFWWPVGSISSGQRDPFTYCSLLPGSDRWTPEEKESFQKAFHTYGKDFHLIQKQVKP